MFSQYFGQYLFNEGILTAEQLYNIFEYKESVKVKLGTLAMTSGLVSAAQVEEILEIQKTDSRRFGEIAIEKEYLTVQQVEQMLNAQKNTHVSLSQALVNQKYLSYGEIERHLENFYHQHSSTTISQNLIKPIEPKDIEAVVKMFMNFSESGSNAKWYYNYVTYFLKHFSQQFNENPAISSMAYGSESASKRLPKNTFFWRITQNIPHGIHLKISIVMDEATLSEVAKRLNKSVSVTEAPANFITRYFNTHNNEFWSSILCNKESDDDKIATKLPPAAAFRQKPPFDCEGYIIPVACSFGQIDIWLEEFKYESRAVTEANKK